MTRVIFLLEEPSMKTFLDTLLPRVFPDLLFQCVPHVGFPERGLQDRSGSRRAYLRVGIARGPEQSGAAYRGSFLPQFSTSREELLRRE